MDPTINAASIISGEALQCGFVGMLAVMNILQRNKRMNGYDPHPGFVAKWIAINYYKLPDITDGRKFVFSGNDMELPAVKRIVAIESRGPPLIIQCQAGLSLYIW